MTVYSNHCGDGRVRGMIISASKVQRKELYNAEGCNLMLHPYRHRSLTLPVLVKGRRNPRTPLFFAALYRGSNRRLRVD